jgi:hypothetical protein
MRAKGSAWIVGTRRNSFPRSAGTHGRIASVSSSKRVEHGAERHSQNALVGVSSAATSEPAARRYRRRSALAARGHLLHPAKHPVARLGKSVTGEKPWHHVSKRVSCSLAEPTTSGRSTHS